MKEECVSLRRGQGGGGLIFRKGGGEITFTGVGLLYIHAKRGEKGCLLFLIGGKEEEVLPSWGRRGGQPLLL